ncbi:hypothetical protein N657DRAFT_682587 [Parathielavia appendiculata]|uniref:DUF7082 domain-containing protein n=1 Tax=Parathielavia appendiculata TaxID=2587402 RepID=A0AAN6TWN9_9PEZI|nr:hypothetical protein N657DRAFT_682587 [Parathielavia appendiculata]
MSATKIQQPVYKLYEPGYHPHRTIILDEQVESPETLTIRLEEEAARNGGNLSGGCPPGLLPLPMSAYKPQPSPLHGYADSYSQYSSQTFPSQQTDNAAAQLNQMAFAANSPASAQYLDAQVTPAVNISVLSCNPSSGSSGTKVSVKATCQYDLLGSGLSAPAPFVSLVFGSQRCSAHVSRDSRDGNGVCTYTLTAEAPQFISTGSPSLSNLPLTLLLENANGEEIARVGNIGAFSYRDAHDSARGGAGVPDDSSQSDLGSPKTRSPVHRASPPHQVSQGRPKPASPVVHQQLPDDAPTNTYGYSSSVSAATAAAQIQAQSQIPDFSATSTGSYSQGNSNMLFSYRAASFTDHYSRAPPILRSPHGTGWMFNSQLDPLRAPTSALAHSTHDTVRRPSLTLLQHSASPAPQLIRTSTLNQPASGFPGYGVYQEKATLKIVGDLASMSEGWTQEEWENKRRLVLFKKQQAGSTLTVSFKPVSVAERPPHSICISCIWWQEKQACYVTSVDTIHLLEQLLAAPNRFGVDEKNRIRRNLEGFRPATVSKSRSESEEFFKVIMGFGNPKPRNIEKDVKVFQWKDLGSALYKIISKYSASTTTTLMTPATSTPVPAAVGLGGSYPGLPPTPVSATSSAAADPASAASYVGATGHHHADSLTSPRTLTGGTSVWPTSYGSAAAKTMSPALKTNPPVTDSSLRLSTTLPVVYDHRGSTHSLTSPYGSTGSSSHHSHSTHHGHGGTYGHHPAVPASQSQPRNWEGYSVAEGYPSHTGGGHSQMYGGGAYGDGGPRA